MKQLAIMHKDRESAIAGTLLGIALGDALGLACEGMGADAIARRFGRIDDFHILGRTGFVSDDTEQSALVAQSLARSEDLESCRRAFRRAMLGWFLRLPWGIGLGTIRACFKIGLGLRRSGVMSAGNGAAMRAGVVGAVFADDAAERQAYGRALAEVTHRDARAVDGALFVAELTALSVGAPSDEDRGALVERALSVVREQSLAEAIASGLAKARDGASAREAGEALGTSGFVVHSVPMATYAFVRFGSEPVGALTELISAGGDTDTHAAILGSWLGALHGEASLPSELIDRIQDGPFGPTHLRALAKALATGTPPPSYSSTYALLRNLAMYPVVLAHGFRRLVP